MNPISSDGNIRWGRVFLWIIIFVVVTSVVGVGLTYWGLGLRWAEKPAEILDPDNVEDTYEQFYEQHQGLRALWANLQATEDLISDFEQNRSEDRSTWPIADRQVYEQHTETRRQQLTSYNNACAKYQSMWDNVFRNIVAPGDIPRECTLIVQ